MLRHPPARAYLRKGRGKFVRTRAPRPAETANMPARDLRRQDAQHRRIAKITLPIWLYVSITGVLIYVMLYHLNTPPAS